MLIRMQVSVLLLDTNSRFFRKGGSCFSFQCKIIWLLSIHNFFSNVQNQMESGSKQNFLTNPIFGIRLLTRSGKRHLVKTQWITENLVLKKQKLSREDTVARLR